jgi:hypothetical protein
MKRPTLPKARNNASEKLSRLSGKRYIEATRGELSGYYYAAKRLKIMIRVCKTDLTKFFKEGLAYKSEPVYYVWRLPKTSD